MANIDFDAIEPEIDLASSRINDALENIEELRNFKEQGVTDCDRLLSIVDKALIALDLALESMEDVQGIICDVKYTNVTDPA